MATVLFETEGDPNPPPAPFNVEFCDSAGNWAAKRRAIDRALLAQAEREIEAQERKRETIDNAARAAIARAFGRPS
ncbi:MAG TPA: hypothetical protein VFE60_13095 [Roseiarcus sp.]|nr:hypothetical protein [Roseiarcus sp.]